MVRGCFLWLSLCFVLGISDLSPKCLCAEREIILAQRETFGLLSESFDLIKVRETGILPNKLKLAITLSPVCFGGDGVKCRKHKILHLLRAWTNWTDKICLALQKVSTKFVSAKFSICQAWAHWDTAKYLLLTCVNHMRQEPPSQRSKIFRIYQT